MGTFGIAFVFIKALLNFLKLFDMENNPVPNEEQNAKTTPNKKATVKITPKSNLQTIKTLLAAGKISAEEVTAMLTEEEKKPEDKAKVKLNSKSNLKTVKTLLEKGDISQDEVILLLTNPEKSKLTADKVRKTPDVPARQRDVCALGAKVFINWNTHFNTLQVPDVDRNLLDSRVQQLNSAINGADNVAASKKLNTQKLIDINKAIDKAVKQLKIQLQVLYSKPQLKAMYAIYGLSADTSAVHKLPADNNMRQAKLALLVQKLQEANNPIVALPGFDLSEWLNLQTEHSRIWLDSENLRQERSDLAQTVRDMYELVQADLKRIRSYMGFHFSKRDVASRRRLMGFLKESV